MNFLKVRASAKKFGHSFLEFSDFFLPRICSSCGENLRNNEILICRTCLEAIPLVNSKILKNEYQRKFGESKFVDEYLSLFLFQKGETLQDLIHSLKYENRFSIGTQLGKILVDKLSSSLNKWNADFIIPVPLHKLKKAERGYNQSYFIARGIKKKLGLPIKNNLVKRIKYTQSQTTLNAEQRKNNVKNIFRIKNPEDVNNKKIIILDDVITTGSTMSELASLLKKNKAVKVFALSVALAY